MVPVTLAGWRALGLVPVPTLAPQPRQKRSPAWAWVPQLPQNAPAAPGGFEVPPGDGGDDVDDEPDEPDDEIDDEIDDEPDDEPDDEIDDELEREVGASARGVWVSSFTRAESSGPTVARMSAAGAFSAWRRRRVEQGAPDAHVKTPLLSVDGALIDALRGMTP